MNTRVLRSILLSIPLVFSIPASAQYLYLDSNGDGVHTAADKLHPVGPTTVDLWLDTARDRDGTATVCKTDPSVSLDIFSYVVNLDASGGTVSYSSYANAAPGFFLITPGNANSTQFTTGFWAGSAQSPLPPGLYRLGTLTIAVQSGFPDVEAVPIVALTSDPTLFGSTCDEHEDGANSIFLGLDWFDVDGLARPGSRGAAAAPRFMNGVLSFATERDGAARIRLFDVQGRLVETLLDTSSLSAGPHSVRFEGQHGRMAAGIYYYRLESTAGAFAGRLAVTR